MSISLRTALESEDPQAQETKERTLVMKGPLAEVYTQALDIAYAKDEAATGQPAVESQAIDAAVAQKLAKLLVPGQASAQPSAVVYGVQEAQMSEQEVVEVINELADKPEETDFYLVIDATQPGPNGDQSSAPQERVVELSAAMETMVKACGGKVYRSFKAMAKDITG